MIRSAARRSLSTNLARRTPFDFGSCRRFDDDFVTRWKRLLHAADRSDIAEFGAALRAIDDDVEGQKRFDYR